MQTPSTNQTWKFDGNTFVTSELGGGSTSITGSAYMCDPLQWYDTGATLPVGCGCREQLFYIVGNYAYLVGGVTTAGAVTDKIFSASLSNLLSWADTGQVFPTVMATGQVAQIGSYLYTFGGYTSTPVDKIYSASIATPTVWSDTGKVLPAVRAAGNIVIVNDVIMYYGGTTAAAFNTSVDTIYSASINTPTTWVDTGKLLPMNMYMSISATTSKRVLLFGGNTGAAYKTEIYEALLTEPEVMRDSGAALPVVLWRGSSFIIDNNIYILGATTAAAAGTTNVWSSTTQNPRAVTNVAGSLPQMARGVACMYDGYAYMFGAIPDGATTIAKIYRTKQRVPIRTTPATIVSGSLPAVFLDGTPCTYSQHQQSCREPWLIDTYRQRTV